MKPRPVQKPRPPIMIAARRSKMLQHAARYGDAWNAFGHFEGTFEQGIEANRRANELINSHCAKIHRDPSTLRRCVLVIESDAFFDQGPLNFYESEEAFRQKVGQYTQIGITEFMLPYPFCEEQIPGFEKIARDVIPKLRS